jgi:succinate dehydrogenase/fumarate reductase flavoprotein subunit
MRAMAMPYAEEVDLVEEEMRRVLQLLRWRAEWWRWLVGRQAEGQLEPLREGHAAYAHKQAAYMDTLVKNFEKLWKDVPAFLERVLK